MRTGNTPKYVVARLNPLILVGVFIIVAAVAAVPFYSTHSSSLPTGNAARANALARERASTTISKRKNVESVASMSLLPLPVPQAGVETVEIFGADCTTPKTTFNLGDVVCAKVTGAPDGRRLAWVDPAGFIEKRTDITTSPQTDTFTLPETSQSVLGGVFTVENRGTWRVNSITSRGSVKTGAFFTVKDPDNPVADLSIIKTIVGNNPAAGGTVKYSVTIRNHGPNDATNVHFVDDTFTNATFDSMTQTGGLPFTCATGGTPDCTIALFPKDSEATFVLNFTAGTAGSDIQNTASVTSDITEVNAADNESTTAPIRITTGGSASSCTITCPGDVTKRADTTDQDGNSGAVVHFSPPSGDSSCGTITTDHCNDCFFPVGSTTVNSSGNGDSCSFTVTVTPADGPAITCPENKEANADSHCQATVDVGTPTATGNNITITGSRSDGLPFSDPYPVGITTITWTATSHSSLPATEENETGNDSCKQTVTVFDKTAPTISAADQTASADANCQAPVPDFTASATTSDNCADPAQITVTQSPAAGTMVGTGPHTITLTATDEANNSSTTTATFTVNDTTAPVISCPANITQGNDPGTCSANINPGTPTASDNCGSPTVTGTRSDGQALNTPYPKGTTTITWTATDGAGISSSCTQTITVNDTEKPTITLNGQTPSLWPANHKYRTFQVSDFVTGASDNCDTLGVGSVVIAKITSDETENGNGDGNTMNDIVIGGDCKSFQLRAERDGGGNGRIYTITFRVRDTSGNTTTVTAKVVVPHNPGETPVDSGPHYTVTSGCP